MSGLTMKVTTAGRTALVNAENTGTLPVLVTQVGVTATGFTANPAGSDMVLPGELKRLATFAGLAVSDDTIHVTLRDDSADVYSLKGFALYLADGTLFALYGQAEEIMGKSAQSTMLLATDVQFVDIDATSLTFGDTSFINPPATTTVQGVTQYATNEVALTGTAGNRSIVASALKYVLDQRFGVGAPSVFVKGLLNLATAAMFRAALEIKSAGLKDEGAGNDLDADLLDGQHGAYYRAWSSLTGVPLEFTPNAHPHAAGDITSGTLVVARGGTGLAAYTAGSFFYASAAGTMGQRTPAQVLVDIGAAAVAHSHDAGHIISGTLADARIPDLAIAKTTGLQGALNAKANLAGAIFSGDIGVHKVNARISVGLADANGGLANFGGDGTGQVGLYSNFVGGILFFRPNGVSSSVGQLLVTPTDISWNGNTIHHLGNFNPALKANLASPTFTGTINTQFLAASGGITASQFTATSQNFISGTGSVVLATNGPGNLYLRANGAGSATGQVRLEASGNCFFSGGISATSLAQSSSRRYKRDIESITAEGALSLLSGIEFSAYTMRQDGSRAVGVIAEDLADGPLDFVVKRNEDGEPDAVDYQPLFVLAACALQGLASRVAALEG